MFTSSKDTELSSIHFSHCLRCILSLFVILFSFLRFVRELYQLTELHFRLDLDQTQRGIILQKQMNGVDSIHGVNSPPSLFTGG